MTIDGRWNMAVATPMGERKGSASLSTDGSTLTGQLDGEFGTVPLYDGVVDGSSVRFKADVTQPMTLTLSFDGNQNGDEIAGSVELGTFGTSTFRADRAT